MIINNSTKNFNFDINKYLKINKLNTFTNPILLYVKFVYIFRLKEIDSRFKTKK